MRGVNPGEVWMIDFGIAAKVRPPVLLTGEPAADELAALRSQIVTSNIGRGGRRYLPYAFTRAQIL